MANFLFPFAYVPDPNKGKPVALGEMYFGEADKDPENFPIQVYARQEDGTDIPISLGGAIELSAGGVPTYNGFPVQITTNEAFYSLRVYDRLGAVVYFAELVEGQLSYYDHRIKSFVTIADAISSNCSAGEIFVTSGYQDAFDGGGAEYIVFDPGSYSQKAGDLVLDNGNIAQIQWVESLDIASVGVLGGLDKSSEFSAIVTRAESENIHLSMTQDATVSGDFSVSWFSLSSPNPKDNKPVLNGDSRFVIDGFFDVYNIKFKDWTRPFAIDAATTHLYINHCELKNCPEGLRTIGQATVETYFVENVKITNNFAYDVVGNPDVVSFITLSNRCKNVVISDNRAENIISAADGTCYIYRCGYSKFEDPALTLDTEGFICENNSIENCGRVSVTSEDDQGFGIIYLGVNGVISGNVVTDVNGIDPIYAKGQAIVMNDNSVLEHTEGGISIKYINGPSGVGILPENVKANTATGNVVKTSKDAISGAGALLTISGYGSAVGNSIYCTGDDWRGLTCATKYTGTTGGEGNLVVSGNSIYHEDTTLNFGAEIALGAGDIVFSDNVIESTGRALAITEGDDGFTGSSVTIANNLLKSTTDGGLYQINSNAADMELIVVGNTIDQAGPSQVYSTVFRSSDNRYIMRDGTNAELWFLSHLARITSAHKRPMLISSSDTFVAAIDDTTNTRACIRTQPTVELELVSITDTKIENISGSGMDIDAIFRTENGNDIKKLVISGASAQDSNTFTSIVKCINQLDITSITMNSNNAIISNYLLDPGSAMAVNDLMMNGNSSTGGAGKYDGGLVTVTTEESSINIII